MKTTSRVVLLVLMIGTGSLAVAQSPAIVHNTWESGAAMPTAIWEPAGVAVLKNEIYVVGGNTSVNSLIGDMQIYNPATNTWSTCVPLPSPLDAGSARARPFVK